MSNNTNQGATATARRPQPQTGGYGASNFGAPKPIGAQPARPLQARPAPAPQPKPVRPVQARTTAAPVVAAPVVKPVSTPVSLPPAKKSASKVPLVLTIVGVVVFIGGVAALFIYALGK